MGKNMRKALQPEIMRQIRNNVRKGNFSRVSDLVMSVLKRDDEDKTKHELMKTIYRDAIEPYIVGIKSDAPIPRQYESMLFEYARYEQGQGDLERALEVLNSMKESELPKTRKKVNRQINLINLSQELSKGKDIDIGAIEKIANDIEQDADSRTYIELISSVFGKEFSIDKLSLGELEKYIAGTPKEPSDIVVDPVKRTYPEELQVENRMKFFKEELDIEPNIRFCDKGIFSGSILLGLKDTDWILVEKVIDMYADGTYEPNNYGSSTYILPRSKMLELIKLQTRERVKEQLKGDEIGGIPPIQHRADWKKDIKDAIEQIKNVSKVQTTDTDEPEQDEEIEPIDPEQPESPIKFKSKIRHVDNIVSNRDFLQDINASLDGILTSEMIEQLVKRTSSYSFESIYNNRLKKKIFESLELLDVPVEQMDVEAKKIFLVMKMTRDDMSRLKAKEGSKVGISEEDLAYLTEQYSCYYDDTLSVLKKGMKQGLDYKQITDEMKKCILIEETEKGKQTEKTSTQKINELEVPSEPFTEGQSDNIQDNKEQEETTQDEVLSQEQQTTPGIERLLEDMMQNANGNPIMMNVVRKIQGFLTRIAELDAEQLQANKELEDIINEEEKARSEAEDRVTAQKLAKERLEQAIKEEREASVLAEQAISAEHEVSKRKQESEERQRKIAEEKASIQKKLEEFIEL